MLAADTTTQKHVVEVSCQEGSCGWDPKQCAVMRGALMKCEDK